MCYNIYKLRDNKHIEMEDKDMKCFNDLKDAVEMLRNGVKFKHLGEVYIKETAMAVVNVETGKVLIKGLDF